MQKRERTFLRHFKAGTMPGEYLVAVRIDRARELLESSSLSVDAIALECGFGSAATLRHHFRSRLGIMPTAYRNRFRKAFGSDRRYPIQIAAGWMNQH